MGRRSFLTSFSFLLLCKTLLALSKTSIGLRKEIAATLFSSKWIFSEKMQLSICLFVLPSLFYVQWCNEPFSWYMTITIIAKNINI